jgi:hypothetical protein
MSITASSSAVASMGFMAYLALGWVIVYTRILHRTVWWRDLGEVLA